MKIALVSDAAALGVMEVRPEPAWRVKMAGLRNKDLLAPDYGAMHVAAYLKAAGHPVNVINVVADVHFNAELFLETETDAEAMSGSPIAGEWAARASRDHLFGSLRAQSPDVILVTLSIYNLALFTRRLLGEIRETCPGAVLVTGGIYSSMHAEEILSDGHVDVVVRGEGEITCAELVERLRNGEGPDGVAGVSYRRDGRATHNPARPRLQSLDDLPHQYTVSGEFNIKRRFDALSRLLPGGDWIPGAGFLTSRGCPEACSFCLDPAINNRRTRFHSPAYVREVLDFCAENFTGGAGSFFFGDATFTMNRKRLRMILGLLEGLPFTYQIQTRADYLDRGLCAELAGRGFTTVAIGAESFNETILREVAKKRLRAADVLEAALAVRETGMDPVLTFITGLPGETRDSVWRTVEILKKNGLRKATFFPLVVFKGTELYDLFLEMTTEADRDALRLNPASEEFLFTSDEFPTGGELTRFTAEVNRSMHE